MSYTPLDFFADCYKTGRYFLNGKKEERINSWNSMKEKVNTVYKNRLTDYLESKYKNGKLEDPRKSLMNKTLQTLNLKDKQAPPEEHYSKMTLLPLMSKDLFQWSLDHKVNVVAIGLIGYFFPKTTLVGLCAYSFFKFFD